MSFFLATLIFVNLVVLIYIKCPSGNSNLLRRCLILIITIFGLIYVGFGFTGESSLPRYWLANMNFDKYKFVQYLMIASKNGYCNLVPPVLPELPRHNKLIPKCQHGS